MLLEIITPKKKLYSGEVSTITLPGSEGSFGILNDHAPIISTLKAGEIKIVEQDNNTTAFPVNGGVAEVNNNKVIILAE